MNFQGLRFLVGLATVVCTSVILAPVATSQAQNVSSTIKFPGPAWTPLSAAQTAQLDRGKPAPVIIVLRTQPSTVGTPLRRAAVASAQRQVVSVLATMRATNVHTFSIINAVGATLAPPAISYLSSDPQVTEIVPDVHLFLPRPQIADLGTVAQSSDRYPAKAGACNINHPLLEPEALGQIKDRFQNPKQPGQAALLANGSGVNVGFIADGVSLTNTDFMRANGLRVVAHARDFSGAGGIYPGGPTEGMLDASSIAAQGNNRYFIGRYTAHKDPAYNKSGACPVIRVMGAAPGATLFDLQAYGAYGTTSSIIDSIQWAVAHGVNILNESFGGNPYPDRDMDPITLADKTAVAKGVVITASSGDAGIHGTLGAPASYPGVISVGASTSFQSYQQMGQQGFSLSNGSYVDNGVSSLSSGGSNQLGTSGVDLLAPGDLNWAVCDPAGGCFDENNQPAGVFQSGGTSESAPLTAGVAALVWQVYREHHHGQNPTPAIVKQIITSTATDLHLPGNVQGAGLLNAYKAVEAAAGWKATAPAGAPASVAVSVNDCLTAARNVCDSALSANGAPGRPHTFSVQVTNTGSATESVTPQGEYYAADSRLSLKGSIRLSPRSDPHFVAPAGDPLSYRRLSFVVKPGATVVNAAIGYDVMRQPGGLVRLALLNPANAYACYSLPQGSGNGYNVCTVHDPMPGRWTMIVMTYACDSGICRNRDPEPGFAGWVHWSVNGLVSQPAGTVSPTSATLTPGATATFAYAVKFSMRPGDKPLSLAVHYGAGPTDTAVVPVILRSLVPVRAAGGSFRGTFTGGNGRPGAANAQVYQFRVPKRTPAMSVALRLLGKRSNDNVQVTLTDPSGLPVDAQDNVAAFDPNGNPIAYQRAVQLFRRTPAAGMWTLTVMTDYFSGPATAQPFKVSISFADAPVQTAGIPQNGSVSASYGQSGSVTVTNRGRIPELFFLDPRLSSRSGYSFHLVNTGNPSAVVTAQIGVPPLSTVARLSVTGSKPGRKVDVELVNVGGGPPAGEAGNPDVWAEGSAPHANSATATALSSSELPGGLWYAIADDLTCPCNGHAAVPEVFSAYGTILTRQFDSNVQSSTADFWTDSKDFKPLVLLPGQTGTMSLTFMPGSSSVGSRVSGDVYVETLPVAVATAPNGKPELVSNNNYVTDEVAAVPYSYHVTP